MNRFLFSFFFLVQLSFLTSNTIAAPVTSPWNEAHTLNVISRGLFESIFSPKTDSEQPTPTPVFESMSSTPEPYQSTPLPVVEYTPTVTPLSEENPILPTPTPLSSQVFSSPPAGDTHGNNLGAGTTATTAVGSISFVAIVVIAIAVVVPALLIYIAVRRRASATEGFENMPPTEQADTYSSEARRNPNFSVGDE